MQQHSNIAPSTYTPVFEQDHSHCFFGAADIASFAQLLEKPYRHFIEMSEYVHLPHVLDFIRGEYPHISLSLTTKTAFRQPVAELMARHIAQQHPVSEHVMMDIRTCLQEAIMNSIIHGNLMIEHDGGANDHFGDYLDTIGKRMEDDSLSLRRISIYGWFTNRHITLCVADQGRGFTLEQPHLALETPFGRGLGLIRHMTSGLWQTVSNRLYMQFACHA